MAKDRTSVERQKRYRDNLKIVGMIRVATWVPTEDDSRTIRQMAKEMRDREKEQRSKTS